MDKLDAHYEAFLSLANLLDFSYGSDTSVTTSVSRAVGSGVPKMWALREILSSPNIHNLDLQALLYGFIRAYADGGNLYVGASYKNKGAVEEVSIYGRRDIGVLAPLGARRCVFTEDDSQSCNWGAGLYTNDTFANVNSGLVSPVGMPTNRFPVFILNARDYDEFRKKRFGSFQRAPHAVMLDCYHDRSDRKIRGKASLRHLLGVYHDLMIAANIESPFDFLPKLILDMDGFEAVFRDFVDTMEVHEKAAIASTILVAVIAFRGDPTMLKLLRDEQALYYRMWLRITFCYDVASSISHDIILEPAKLKLVDFSFVLAYEVGKHSAYVRHGFPKELPKSLRYYFPLSRGADMVFLQDEVRSDANSVGKSIQPWAFGLILEGLNVHQLARMAFKVLPNFHETEQYLFWLRNEVDAESIEEEVYAPHRVEVFGRTFSCARMQVIKQIGEELYNNFRYLRQTFISLSSSSDGGIGDSQ